MSELPTVVQAFSAVQAEITSVTKDGKNTQQNYNFRGIDGVVNAAGPALRKHGVVITPNLRNVTYRDIEVGQKRTTMREVTVEVEYVVRGPAGDSFSGVVPGESMDSGDKGTAKAMSVAYRIFLLQGLTIPTMEPDPDEHSYERAPRAQAQPPAEPVASAATHEQIRNIIGVLNDEQTAAFRGWYSDQGFPPIKTADRLTERQAEAVLSYLDALPADGLDPERPFEEVPA